MSIPIGKKAAFSLLGVLGSGGAALLYSIDQKVSALTDVELHPPKFPWSHIGLMKSYDHQAVRRGYEVYKNVCAACHSMQYLRYKELADVCMTEKEAKEEAEAIMVEDGPNDDGEMFMRPGTLVDFFPSPYKNKQAAMLANNGAAPPDLTYIVKGREGHEDYIFSLLTNYSDPPAGVEIPEGAHYNVYFKGGVINMAPPLYNEIIEYSDGTPATLSQTARDVVSFLSWAASPEHDYRKRLWLKMTAYLGIACLAWGVYNRFKWLQLKYRRFEYIPPAPKGKRTKK